MVGVMRCYQFCLAYFKLVAASVMNMPLVWYYPCLIPMVASILFMRLRAARSLCNVGFVQDFVPQTI